MASPPGSESVLLAEEAGDASTLSGCWLPCPACQGRKPDEPSAADLAFLRDRAGVTDAPWEHDLDCERRFRQGEIDSPNGGGICRMVHHGNINTVARTGEDFSSADARYIVTACNSASWLVRELERLRAENINLGIECNAHRHRKEFLEAENERLKAVPK